MFYDKSNLLDRINIAINKKWYKKGPGILDIPVNPKSEEEQTGLINKKNFTDSKNAKSLEKLEAKIKVLENQYDQLLYFINFLVDNLPNLVLNIVSSNPENKEVLSGTEGSDPVMEQWSNGKSATPKNIPCPTRREKDILHLLEKGFCAKEIAERLFISETTVITHKKNLKEKFNAKNTVELISKAQSHLLDKKP